MAARCRWQKGARRAEEEVMVVRKGSWRSSELSQPASLSGTPGHVSYQARHVALAAQGPCAPAGLDEG